MNTLQDIIDEVVSEYMAAFQSVFEETVMPLLKKRTEMEKKAYDKAYTELVELEREV